MCHTKISNIDYDSGASGTASIDKSSELYSEYNYYVDCAHGNLDKFKTFSLFHADKGYNLLASQIDNCVIINWNFGKQDQYILSDLCEMNKCCNFYTNTNGLTETTYYWMVSDEKINKGINNKLSIIIR